MKSIQVSGLALLAAIAGGPTRVLAQAITNPANCHTYMLSPTGSWKSAEAFAVSVGGHLATVRSASEQAWIMGNFISGANARRIVWIGLTDEAAEGSFQWISGEQHQFRKWGPGEPNDYRGCISTGEDWVAMNWEFGNGNNNASPGDWNDTPDKGIAFGCVNKPHPGLVEVPHPLIVVGQSQRLSVCSIGEAAFVITPMGTGPFAFRWQQEVESNTWTDLSPGPIVYSAGTITASDVATDRLILTLSTTPGAPLIRFRCIVTNSCGSVTSEPATLVPCQSDLTCDNVVDDADFVVFAAAYNMLDCSDPAMEAGCPADLNGDGLVDDADFVLFVAAYNALGCL